MTDNSDQTTRLDLVDKPIAIVHDGFFVYANSEFVAELGFRNFAALQETPILDLVESGHQELLRQLLDRGKNTAGTEQRHPVARLTFIRADGLPLSIDSSAFKTRYGGEEGVQLTLRVNRDQGLIPRVRRLPWKLYLSIAFLILFTVLPSSMLLKLNIDNTPKVFFPDDEPAVVLDDQLREMFPSDQVVVLLFEGVALFSDGFLEALDSLADEISDIELVDEVIAVTTRDHIAGTEQDFIVERLIDVDDLASSTPNERQKRLASDRLTKGVLTAEDGSALAMIVIPHDIADSLGRLSLEDAINAALAESRLTGYVTATAGWIQVDIAELRSMLRDNMIFIPATVTIGLLLIWWLFRRWVAVAISGVAIGVVTNSTVAFYVLFGQPFTLISSIIPPLLSALTVAALVHFFNAVYQAARQGYVGKERVARALIEVRRPAKFTALTTVAGLASLATSPIVPIKMFGIISACGTALIYVVVYMVIPNLFARFDAKPWPRVRGGLGAMDAIVRRLYRVGTRYPGPILAAFVVGLGVLVPQVAKVEVETNIQEFFSADHPIRVDTRRIEEKLQGTNSLDIRFDTAARDGLKDPELLAKIRAFQHWVEALPAVDRSTSMGNFLEEMHWAFNAENDAYRLLPTDEQLISQYLLIYDGGDLYDFVDRDFRHSRVALSLNVHSANDISTVMTQIRDYLSAEFGDEVSWEIAGAGRLFADMEELLVKGQVYSLWGALVLIFGLMLILWRSLGDSLLCMVPNLSPILLIFIVMGVFGIWLDMGTAMIASVAVGIAVDDTIHVYHGFRHRIAQGASPVLAIVRTYRQAGRAVVITTVILSAQFLILVASEFVPTRNFGLLTTVGLITALLFDLVLMPALLIVFFGPKRPLARLFGAAHGTDLDALENGVATGRHSIDVHWSPDRKTALVKEIYRGKSVIEAAQEYGLSKAEIERWLASADVGIKHAFEGYSPEKLHTYEKQLKKLAKLYKRTLKENEDLKRGRTTTSDPAGRGAVSPDQAAP